MTQNNQTTVNILMCAIVFACSSLFKWVFYVCVRKCYCKTHTHSRVHKPRSCVRVCLLSPFYIFTHLLSEFYIEIVFSDRNLKKISEIHFANHQTHERMNFVFSLDIQWLQNTNLWFPLFFAFSFSTCNRFESWFSFTSFSSVILMAVDGCFSDFWLLLLLLWWLLLLLFVTRCDAVSVFVSFRFVSHSWMLVLLYLVESTAIFGQIIHTILSYTAI